MKATETIDVTERTRDRFDDVRESCGDDYAPPPTDDVMVSSLLDEWGHDHRLFDAHDRATFEAAIEEWGIDAQVDMAEEEAAEFIVASKHYARGKADRDELIDELADLRIMYEQLAGFVGKADVDARVQAKMDRLRDRLPRDAEVDNGE